MSRHVVAAVDEIPQGSRKIVTVRGREIGIFNVADNFYGLINRCPHQGAPLCRGEIVSRLVAPSPGDYRLTRPGEMLRCPWHCWEFDIRTGQSWCDPVHTRVKAYHTMVESGAEIEHEKLDDKAKGPYVAETFAVSVADDYVLVDV